MTTKINVVPQRLPRERATRRAQRPTGWFWLSCLWALTGLVASPRAARAATLPSGFSETRLVAGLDPNGIEFAPDGRLFVTIKSGTVRIIKNGTLLATPFVTIPNVDPGNERGLQSITFDPNFTTNGYVYVYYTVAVAGQASHNRVSRFTAAGDVAVAGSETVLIELNDLSAGYHNGGGLVFKGGQLFITTGENTVGSNAQTLSNLLGKVLRLNPDGSIPTDNPFYATATGPNRAIWALGFRNPFRAAVQPGTGRIFVNDVGNSTWEEINEVTTGGRNYGWPGIEGVRTTQTAPANYQDPVYAYNHSGGSCAITGGAFFNPPASAFPGSYVGKYFFTDYCNGSIKVLDFAAGNAVATFATGIDRPIDVKAGPDGNLYYVARGGLGGGSDADNTSSNAGEIWRVQYAGTDAPSISAQPVSRTAAVGSAVSFVVGASGGAPLAYQWQRNGVSIAGATAATYRLAAVALADDGATFRVVVTNPVSSVTSNGATLSVSPNQAPTAAITAPAAGTTYRGGDVVSFAGTGTDPENGALPAGAFAWQVDFHHADHIHPGPAPVFAGGASTGASGTFVIPAQSETAANVWYRLFLRVTDLSGAASKRDSVDIYPRTSTLSFATSPAGLQVGLDGQPLATPAAVLSVEGIERTLSVPSPQTLNGTSYEFVSWSQGGSAAQTISTPTADATYMATFRVVPGLQSGGVYELAPQHAPGSRLNVLAAGIANGTQITISHRDGTAAQAWQLASLGGDLYQLNSQVAGATARRLDVNGASSANGAKVQLWDNNTTAAQRWKFISLGNDVYELEPQCAVGKRLDVVGINSADGTKVESYVANSGSNQRWRLILKVAPVAQQAVATKARANPIITAPTLEIYPNPATDQTVLQYELPLAVTVRLEVLDALGRSVALLVPGEAQVAGRHQATFRAQALTGGLYRVVLRTEATVQSRALLLVR